MKKTLIIITAITLLFTACNADATSGLFRTATQAREAINIKYEQILGIDTDTGTLYFRTSKGIYSQDTPNKQPTLLVASKEGSIIQSAALNSDGKLFYKTNASDTTVYEYEGPNTVATAYPTNDLAIKSVRLLSEGTMILLTNDSFMIGEISGSNVVQKGLPASESVGSDYGLSGIYIPSDYTNTKSPEFIISFVKEGNPASYKNYYFDGSDLKKVTGLTEAIANFAIDSSDNLYILTTNGKLYYYASDSYATPTLLAESSSDFERDGMFYPIEDTGKSKVHFITNPLYTDSMTVFTVPKSNPDQNPTKSYNIKLGYAAALKDTRIVSTLLLLPPVENSFLVATEKHGMYSVKVNKDNVNKNDSSNVVEISKAEEYEF